MMFDADKYVLDYQVSPALVETQILKKAEAIAKKIAVDINLIGILAVEMFLSKDGSLLVNELAPRPHNSGHHTIEGNYTSQFEQHLRSILNLPLGSTDIVIPSVMINILKTEVVKIKHFLESV